MSVHNLKTEAMQSGDVYIGRPRRQHMHDPAEGMLGNPYRISPHQTREQAIARFEKAARRRIATDPEWRELVRGLHGKRLFCYCAPLPCHGDVLEQIAAELVAGTS